MSGRGRDFRRKNGRYNKHSHYEQMDTSKSYDGETNTRPTKFKFKHATDSEFEERGAAESSGRQGKHPKHLKGREIGLFYARKQKEKRNTEPQPLGRIILSENKKEEIQKIIDNCPTFSQNLLEQNAHKVNQFEMQFKEMINGSIEQKLQLPKSYKVQNPDIDVRLIQDQIKKQTNPQYTSMLSRRKKLPSYNMKDDILKLINDNQIVLISGETGCGKTTQVAQFILDDYIENNKGSLCKIMCTQPRRISAVSIAERVAQERAEPLGLSVGYSIRLERRHARDYGSVTFCTTGVLLKQMESDPSLQNVSHLILDEIHERDVISDFVIAIIKQVTTVRKGLKVILMSATLNAENFSTYYNNCPHINIPGLTFPVEEYYLEDVIERTKFVFEDYRKKWDRDLAQYMNDYLEPHVRHLESLKKYSRSTLMKLRNPKSEEFNPELILALLVYICQKENDDGAVLVFLTGHAEISKLHTLIEKCGKFPRNKYIVFPLHSQMPTVNQKEIFETPPPGKRKIILSTNIAETSITIDDVVYVIDCGRIKLTNFNADTNIQTLLPEFVSLANAAQRKGRAGRVRPGVCYHLYSGARKLTLEQYQKPEILRIRLEDVILSAKMLQVGKIEQFFEKLMDKPDEKAVDVSLNLLKRINGIDDDENLTPLGYHLAKLPIGAQTGKMILFGAIFSCLDPILSVAASLDFKDAFQLPLGKENEADRKRLQLSNRLKSDHLLFHEALLRFDEEYNQRQFCREYFLNYNTMIMLKKLKKEFMGYLYEMNFVPNMNFSASECNVNSNNLSLVKAVIAAGLYPNVAIVKPRNKRATFYTPDRIKLELHKKSVLSSETYFDHQFLVYYLKLKSNKNYIHDASIVFPLPLIFFGDHYKLDIFKDKRIIAIGDDIKFYATESTGLIIQRLRNTLNKFLEYKITHPGPVDWNNTSDEIAALRAIMELITNEDCGEIDLDAFDDVD